MGKDLDWSEGRNPYTILGLEKGQDSTPDDIKKAYRRLALTRHPDKNKKNPNAAEEFHELQKAYELLLDKSARAALDDYLSARKAREARLSQQDEKRRKMMADLVAREQRSTAERTEEEMARVRLQEELERLKKRAQEERQKQQEVMASHVSSLHDPGPLPGSEEEVRQQLRRTLKVSWDTHGPSAYTSEKLRKVFSEFGDVEDVILKESKKKSRRSALVVMATADGAREASTAVCGDLNHPLLVVPFARVLPGEEVPVEPQRLQGTSGADPSPKNMYAAHRPPTLSPPAKPLFPGMHGGPTSGPGSAVATSARSSLTSGTFSSFPGVPVGLSGVASNLEEQVLAKLRKAGEKNREAGRGEG